MEHKIKLQSVYFDKVKSGEKIYEIRLNDEKRQKIKIGDTIILKREPKLEEFINVVVMDLLYFSSFEEMANTLPLEKVGFKTETVQEVVDVYHQFYSIENENKYGVVAIKVKTLN